MPRIKANGQLFSQVQPFFVVGRKSDHLLEGTLGKDCYNFKENLEFFLIVQDFFLGN